MIRFASNFWKTFRGNFTNMSTKFLVAKMGVKSCWRFQYVDMQADLQLFKFDWPWVHDQLFVACDYFSTKSCAHCPLLATIRGNIVWSQDTTSEDAATSTSVADQDGMDCAVGRGSALLLRLPIPLCVA